MSEEEQLAENAEAQRGQQRIDELNAYLVRLMANVDRTKAKLLGAMVAYAVAFAATLVTLYAFPVFMIAFLYNVYRVIEGHKALSEARGAVEVLKILGMVPPDRPRGGKRRRFWEAGYDMVRRWVAEKRAAREKAYAPA